MLDVRPFRGLRFNPERTPDLAQVCCPPYDVISPAEQSQLYQRSPHNLVRLELGLGQPGDDERRNRYTRAAETLARWRSEQVLVLEPRPSFYLHLERFTWGGKQLERRDLIARVRLSEWTDGQVRPHERTMDRPKLDRLKLLLATHTQVSPVFALYVGSHQALERAWHWAQQSLPEQHFVDAEGREHRLWAFSDEAALAAIGREFQSRTLYIADGHHRYETALHYRSQCRGMVGQGMTGDGRQAAFEFVLMVLARADDPGLVVLPTHRLLRGLGELDRSKLEEMLSPHFHLQQVSASEHAPATLAATVLQQMDKARAKHVLGMYGPDGGAFTVLSLRDESALQQALPPQASQARRALDVVVLHSLVVQPLLGSRDADQAVTYTRDAVEAVQAVRDGRAQLAFFLRPTQVRQVLAVAEAGERMPEKSTYFYPKPPTGLVLYPIA